MLRKISSLAIFTVALGSYVEAQDSTKKSALNITGSVDAYYRYNFQNVKDTNYATTNNYTSFTNSHNSFELGMASVKAEYTTGKVTGVVDLGFGRRADEFSYNDKGGMTAIKQAYISVAASDKLKFTMGKWATHVGYELVDAYLNRNYSMSYMFSYGPFFHTGLKAEYTAGNFGFMVGVANPTDFVTASFAKKWILGQITASAADGKVKAYLNYQGGKSNDIWQNKIHQVDLVVTGTLSDKFSVGYNGTMQSVKTKAKSSGDSWWGSAVYLNVDPSKVFGVTLRGEYFDDKKAVSTFSGATGVGTSVFAATLSGNIRIDNLTIIPEFRLDNSKDEIFLKSSGAGVKSTGSFILAATWHF